MCNTFGTYELVDGERLFLVPKSRIQVFEAIDGGYCLLFPAGEMPVHAIGVPNYSFTTSPSPPLQHRSGEIRRNDRQHHRNEMTACSDSWSLLLSKSSMEHHYTNPRIGLYQEDSMHPFEGEKIQGAQAIGNKYNGFSFHQWKDNFSLLDCQPSGPASGMVVFMSSNLQLPGGEHMLKFSQLGSGEISNGTGASSNKMDPEALSKAFVDHYFGTFDTNLSAIGGFYQKDSTLSIQGENIHGAQAISNHLEGLGLQECKHSVSTMDCQPSGLAGGLFVFVMGNLQLPGKEGMLKFTQMFHLLPTPQGSFYVHNDIFRVN